MAENTPAITMDCMKHIHNKNNYYMKYYYITSLFATCKSYYMFGLQSALITLKNAG